MTGLSKNHKDARKTQDSILVIDDNALNRELLTRRLKQRNYLVQTLSNGQDIIKILTESPQDLILLDIMMPAPNGLEVLKQIRQFYPIYDLPVIMVTAKNQSKDIVGAMEQGANDYTTKPIDFPILFARIKAQLARSKTEKKSKETRQLYRELFENTNDKIVSFTQQGKLLYANKAWFSALQYKELPNLQLQSLLFAKRPEELFQSVRKKLLQDKKIDKIELTFKTKEQELIVFEGTLHCQYIGNQASDFLGIFRDITERKKIERMKNEFISIVSHELRTPLTSIRGSLGLVAGGVTGELPPKSQELLDIAYKNSERLVRLIDDILDIDKIESGKMKFSQQLLPLRKVLERSVQNNHGYASRLGVKLLLEKTVENINVHVDDDRIQQVLTNLISNAAKYSPKGGVVKITSEFQGKFVRISVIDEGPGIPASYQEKIFEKFIQVDASTSRQKGGTGLGLSIAKAIVEKHHGNIGFHTKINKGTTFFFELPDWQLSTPHIPIPMLTQRSLLIYNAQNKQKHLQQLFQASNIQTVFVKTLQESYEHIESSEVSAALLLASPNADKLSWKEQQRLNQSNIPIFACSNEKQIGKSAIKWLPIEISDASLLSRIKIDLQRAKPSKPSILYLEDHHDLFQVLRVLLQEIAQVYYAANLHDAKRLIKQNPPFALVLLDLELPDGRGVELLPLLKNKENTPSILFSAKEVTPELEKQVTASIVKTQTSHQELLELIKQLLK